MTAQNAQTSLTTAQLCLRRPRAHDDAEFMLQLVNEPGWLRFIGDRGVRNADDAERYLLNAQASAGAGLGLWVIERQADTQRVGVCTLLHRAGMEDVDLGFALLAEQQGQGYALEAAAALLRYAVEDLALRRVVAITRIDNLPSQRLLCKLGMKFEQVMQLSAEAPPVQRYAYTVG